MKDLLQVNNEIKLAVLYNEMNETFISNIWKYPANKCIIPKICGWPIEGMLMSEEEHKLNKT